MYPVHTPALSSANLWFEIDKCWVWFSKKKLRKYIWQAAYFSFDSWKNYTERVLSTKEIRSWIKQTYLNWLEQQRAGVLLSSRCRLWPARPTVAEICQRNTKCLWQRVLPSKFCTLDACAQLMSDMTRSRNHADLRIPGAVGVGNDSPLTIISHVGEMPWCHFLTGLSDFRVPKT